MRSRANETVVTEIAKETEIDRDKSETEILELVVIGIDVVESAER
jgi:hypothetical protein